MTVTLVSAVPYRCRDRRRTAGSWPTAAPLISSCSVDSPHSPQSDGVGERGTRPVTGPGGLTTGGRGCSTGSSPSTV